MEPKPREKPDDYPILAFADKQAWVSWLDQEHDRAAGIWLKFAKKNSGIASLNYEEAVDVALCYGWIDGQMKGFDDKYWLQKFTPRRAKSIWSKTNTERAERLIDSGHMQPAGRREIEAAKRDGRWQAAYASQKNMTVPRDFQSALNKNKKARAFFQTLTGANRYAILFRIETAKKAETRARRIEQFVQMLARGEKLHP